MSDKQKFNLEPLLMKRQQVSAQPSKMSFKQKVLQKENKLISNRDLINYNTNHVTSISKNKGMTTKGVDLYVKLNDKIRW